MRIYFMDKGNAKIMAVVLGIIVLLLAIFLHSGTFLIIREYGAEGLNQGLMIPVKLNNFFSIEYMHSVLKTQVTETFRIAGEEQFVLEETTYESLGIGLPSNTPYEFVLSDNKFHIRKINQELPHILMRVGHIANHQILINEQNILLKDYFLPETLLEIKVAENRLYEYWLREK